MQESTRETTIRKHGKVLAINSDPELVDILEINLTHSNLEVITARSGREALNKVRRGKPDVIILDPALPDIDGRELCRKIKESDVTRHIPIILISARAQRNGEISRAVNGADYCITKPFNPRDVVDLVLLYLRRKERTVNLNPLTGLPNQTQVTNEITRLIEQKKIFSALYIAMDDLRLFNRVYGYDQGDHTIRLLADIIVEATRLFGNHDDLVGHLGGDKFVVISTPGKARAVCRRIIADFNRRIKALYSDQHLQRGYATYESPLGTEEQSPIMSLHIAVISSQNRSFYHHLEVSEAAAEQMDYLRRFSGGKSYFDLQADVSESVAGVPNRILSSVNREEIRAMFEVLTWLDFVVKELDFPVTELKSCLEMLDKFPSGDISLEYRNSLEIIHDNVNSLSNIVEGLVYLTKTEWLSADASLEEVLIDDTLAWVLEQLQGLINKYGIETEIDGADDIGRLLIDGRKLSQCLLCILRGEVQSSQPGDRLVIVVTEEKEELIKLQITNANHYVPQQTLNMLLKGQQEGMQNNVLRSQLYPARLLAEALGGELRVVTGKIKGITYVFTVPKKWKSSARESTAIQMAVDISREAAKAEISNIRRQLSSGDYERPDNVTESLERLSSKVQELGVLCNRSLYLADEVNSRLESQQDRLLQQDTEQLASLEAIMTICREIARSIQIQNVFDFKDARTVAKYALEIAKELKLPERDCHILYYAAFLKDIGLLLSPDAMLEQSIVNSTEKAASTKALFSTIWQALSTIPFLSPALLQVIYRYDKYGKKPGLPGVSGDSIPLGSRILAIADTFHILTSAHLASGQSSPNLAVQKIVDQSGLVFNPNVVRAFLTVWKKGALN